MPVVPVRTGEHGAIWDVPAHELPMNIMSNVENATIYESRFKRYGGFRADVAFANGRAMFEVQVQGADFLVRVSDTAIEYSGDLQTWTAITPAGGIQDSREWLLTQLGDWLFISHPGEQPYVWKVGSPQFTPFSNWPAGQTVAKIVPFQGFLLLVGVRRSGVPIGGLIAWSDRVAIDTVDDVEFAAAATNLAGEYTVPTADGPALDALVLRDSVMVYFGREVWKADFVSTAIAGVRQVFSFRSVFSTEGILRARCVVEVKGWHYVVGGTDIYRHDGNNYQTISHARMHQEFFRLLGSDAFAFLHHEPDTQEIYLMYARGSRNYASHGFVYGLDTNGWVSITIPDTVGNTDGVFSHAALGPLIPAAPLTYATAGGNYADYNDLTYSGQTAGQRTRVLYLLSPSNGQIYAAGVAASEASIELPMMIERIDLDMDEVLGSTRQVKYISEIYPLIQGIGDVQIQLGGRDSLTAPVQWDPELVFTSGEAKLDVRISHRYPAIRFMQNGNGNAEISGFDVVVSKTYGR